MAVMISEKVTDILWHVADKMIGEYMAKKVKTAKDYPTLFQITQVDKDKFVLLGVMNRKQLEAMLWRLEVEYEDKSRQWRGQYQALARAIVKARENLDVVE